MDTFQSILLEIKKAEDNKENLNYIESLLIFKAIIQISIEKSILDKIIGLAYYIKESTLKISCLSRRETEIFKLIGLGLTSRDISEILNIQETTVSTHRKHIIKKLGLSGAGQLQKTSIQHLQAQL
jgi:two-component system nitrate/nitrite response regulator NarL